MPRKTQTPMPFLISWLMLWTTAVSASIDTTEANLFWQKGLEALRAARISQCHHSLFHAAKLFRDQNQLTRALDCDLKRADLLMQSNYLKESKALLDSIDLLRKALPIKALQKQYTLSYLYLRIELEEDPQTLAELLSLARALILEDGVANAHLNAELQNLLGLHFFEQGSLDSAAYYLELGLPLAESTADDYLIARIQILWAKVLRRLGDHAKAVDLIQQGIANYQNYYGPVHTVIATGYNDLAINQKQLGQLEAAGESFDKGLAIRAEIHGKRSNAYARILNNAALQVLDVGDIETALKHARETVRIFESIAQPDKQFHVASYNTLAKVLTAKGQHEEAAREYQKALDMHRQAYPGSRRVRYYLISLGKNALDRGQPTEALQHFHEAMCSAIDGLNLDDLQSNPTKDDPSNYQSLKALCLLKAQAWYAQYLETLDTSELRSSIELYELADHFAAKNRTESRYQKSRLAYSRQNVGLYQGAIQSVVEMYERTLDISYLDQAFTYSEKSKSLTLLEDLLEANALRTSDIPEEYLEQERTLQDSLALLRNALIKVGARKDSVQTSKIKGEKIALEIKFDAFKKSLETEFPRFYQSKYDFDFLGIADIQSLLKSDESAISYFVGSDKIIRFVIGKHEADVVALEKPDSLLQWVNHFRQAITEYDPTRPLKDEQRLKNLTTYKRFGYQLYEVLLGGLSSLLTREIMIIPDDVLNYLPFGALLTTDAAHIEEIAALPFLGATHSISYNYSSTLAAQMRNQEGSKHFELLALAPSFEEPSPHASRGMLAPLLFNVREAENIIDHWPGHVLMGNAATEEHFRSSLPDYGIVHFATHALVNEMDADLSFLAFAPGSDQERYLYLQELYNMHMPLNLVTLSACETSLGPLRQGEGIASLAQGFSYAGAKSIITSLWDVEDAAAEQLMTSFYAHLAKGLNKSEALQLAKQDYRMNNPDPMAHPLYWAAFVPIGDMAPLPFPGNNLVPFIACTLVILLALFLFIKRHY